MEQNNESIIIFSCNQEQKKGMHAVRDNYS